MTAPAQPPATDVAPDGASPVRVGWFSDPWRRHQVRFFDGGQWTEHVADGGVAGLDSSPVADLPRSHPRPPTTAPPDGTGPRVVDDEGRPAVPTDPVDVPLLLLDLAPDAEGVRRLTDPHDVAVGRVVARPASLLARLGRLVVTEPSRRVTRLAVLDAAGGEVLRVERPARWLEPVVDVRRGSTLVGRIRAEAVVQGLRADVVDADGTVVGRLAEAASGPAALTVVDGDGMTVARTTPVWDVPGTRHHVPPGVVLVDRRRPEAPAPPADRAALLLGALLAPTLLRPSD